MFIMSLGEFGDLYDTFESTRYSVLGIIMQDLIWALFSFDCFSKDTMVHIYVSSCDIDAEPPHCYDGWYLCKGESYKGKWKYS